MKWIDKLEWGMYTYRDNELQRKFNFKILSGKLDFIDVRHFNAGLWIEQGIMIGFIQEQISYATWYKINIAPSFYICNHNHLTIPMNVVKIFLNNPIIMMDCFCINIHRFISLTFRSECRSMGMGVFDSLDKISPATLPFTSINTEVDC